MSAVAAGAGAVPGSAAFGSLAAAVAVGGCVGIGRGLVAVSAGVGLVDAVRAGVALATTDMARIVGVP